MDGAYTVILNEMIGLVKQAANRMRGDDFEIACKESVVNIVTSADIAVQAFLQEKLCGLLPGSVFFGEEGIGKVTAGEYLWVVDPIDGTMNFARGMGESAVSVALIRNGQPVAAVVYNPFKEELFYAQAGCGAWCNGQRLHTSAVSFSEGLFCTAWSLYNKKYAPQCMAVMEEVYAQCNDFRRFGSCALELCYLAAGRCDLFFEMRVFPWDHAAGGLILQEAGGIVTGLEGTPLPYDRTSPVVAANSAENHDRLTGIVARHIPEVPYEEVLR